jgi:hypothetical protein
VGILRGELSFEAEFTRIPNSWARDRRLSRRARGLLVEIMSHKVGWRLSVQSLIDSGEEGRHAVRGAIEELREAGYLVIEQSRAVHGRFAEVEYRLAIPPESDFLTPVENRTAVRFTASRSSASRKSPPKEDQGKEDQIQELLVPVGTDSPVDRFAEFWMLYPRKVARPDALKAWTKALRTPGVTADVIVAGARRFANDPNLPEKQFIVHPGRWLREARWEDEPLPPRRRLPDVGLDLGDAEYGR